MPYESYPLGRVPAFMRPLARRPARGSAPSGRDSEGAEASRSDAAPDGLAEPGEAPAGWSMPEGLAGVTPSAAVERPARDSFVPAETPQDWRRCDVPACRRRRRCERRRVVCREADRDTLGYLDRFCAHLAGEGPKPDPPPREGDEPPAREASARTRARPGAKRRARTRRIASAAGESAAKAPATPGSPSPLRGG